MRKRTAIAGAAALGLLTGLVAPQVITTATAASGVTPCASEDSPGPCVWDAESRGNGQGRSFFATADGRIFYFGGQS